MFIPTGNAVIDLLSGFEVQIQHLHLKKSMKRTGDNYKTIPELVEMPCSKSLLSPSEVVVCMCLCVEKILFSEPLTW